MSLFFLSSVVRAGDDCAQLLHSEKVAFATILHKKNSDFHNSPSVIAAQTRLSRLGTRLTGQPKEKITSFLDVLERIHTRGTVDVEVRERLRKKYYERFIIKADDIPEAYYKSQQRIAQERGHGIIPYTAAIKAEEAMTLIADQKKSFDSWFDYFSSAESNSFPFYFKYWSFTSMLKLSKFDIEAGVFLKRSKTSVAPFPELNREALALIADRFSKSLKGELPTEVIDDATRSLLSQADFGTLYARELILLQNTQLSNASPGSKIDGVWIKYDQGSDHMPLVKSLEGKGTGWCTAGEYTAKQQLKEGDFHVFYTFDDQGKPTIPRVAIRMNGKHIEELRGVGPGQNLDARVASSDIVGMKLTEFGSEGDRYKKKNSDMKRLTAIEKSNEAGTSITKEELQFLYEFDSEIEGFGHSSDPRIEQIISTRNKRKDIAYVVGVKESEISFTAKEILAGGVKCHYGDLDFTNIVYGKTLIFPDLFIGSLKLNRLTSANNVQFPKTIVGSLMLIGLESPVGLILPDRITDSLILNRLTSAVGVKFPHTVGGSLFLNGLESAIGLKLPDTIGRSIHLGGLKNSDGLKLPKNFEGKVYGKGLR